MLSDLKPDDQLIAIEAYSASMMPLATGTFIKVSRFAVIMCALDLQHAHMMPCALKSNGFEVCRLLNDMISIVCSIFRLKALE